MRVESLPPPYYVSEILYNGAPLRDGILEVNPYSIVRELIRDMLSRAGRTQTRALTDLAVRSGVLD